ncbi:sulfurtransferase TusC [Rodentibacter caecimuris]|uniref:Sulfurtransferase TusC n=1 Tax=Rodentibacter caecimuris TaxID=1796644 RepID=A0A9X8VZG9_9PAST|nr:MULTISPECIES: sulfurtransferase complex subunit TusC [Pasteurellaceae]AOF52890.1 tRNA 5-methylaminomethyl-2-thiouridine synthase TusC [Pasteurellaceae bacterium NI1060]MCQ9123607.1 sulfurtransferase complex subunit TusC [Rodentibacter heylii]MCR1837087.1 sulfurtransferase complex subunit TusC [Pasteurella caecimuris]MCU0106723.1 sulfurtransferase complex subunit TusC [Pasteurella caecimuris]OOF72885.1 sulfurtransferase TusC [Rodentibacter heylii]
MKMAFLFHSAPHGISSSREGLDALLAATAFCDEEDIGVFFIDDGVLNLLNGQQPERLLQKDFIRTFKLLDLYNIKQRFICRKTLDKLGIVEDNLIISAKKIDRTLLLAKLNQAEKLLTF